MLNAFKRIFKRASVNDERYWSEFFQKFSKTKSGQNVTADTAMQATAVQACVRVLAETIASLPWSVFKRIKDEGKESAVDHYVYKLLHDEPNTEQTAFEFKEMVVSHIALRGNHYSYVEQSNAGEIINLWPLNPANMAVRSLPSKSNYRNIVYDYTWENGQVEHFPSDVIWHIRDLSKNGLTGLSRISLAKEAIGLSLAAEDYGARLFQNDTRTTGVLKYPGTLKDENKEKLKEQFQQAHTGENRFRVLLLEGGLDWEQMGMSNEDAQFLESRRFQIEDIARVFRVPAMLIGHPDKTATYASAEQFFLSFCVHTIMPWCVRLEQSANKKLFLTDKEKRKYFSEFNLDALLRGDTTSRYNAYAIGRQNKWLSVNEIRKKENMNPIPDGDKYENPNITVGDKASDKNINDVEGGGEKDADTKTEE